MTEYYQACDMLLTNEISNIAYEYKWGIINVHEDIEFDTLSYDSSTEK